MISWLIDIAISWTVIGSAAWLGVTYEGRQVLAVMIIIVLWPLALKEYFEEGLL